MTVNQSGSQNASLAEGMSDGRYKKIVMDRSNAERTTWESRQDLSDTHFGIHEASPKALGDGSVHVTPGYIATPPAHMP